MALLPSDVPTRLVTATMYFVNEDSVDPDTNPEYTVVTGSVVFTASPKVLRMPSKPAIFVPLTFEGVFNSQGQLIPKNGTGVGMELIVTDSPLLNPRNWTWTCTFNLKVAGTQNTVNIESFSFQLPQGPDPIDLVSLMPVSASGGVLTLQGPPGEDGPAGPAGVADDASMTAVLKDPASEFTGALSATIGDQVPPLVAEAIGADGTVVAAAAAAVSEAVQGLNLVASTDHRLPKVGPASRPHAWTDTAGRTALYTDSEGTVHAPLPVVTPGAGLPSTQYLRGTHDPVTGRWAADTIGFDGLRPDEIVKEEQSRFGGSGGGFVVENAAPTTSPATPTAYLVPGAAGTFSLYLGVPDA